ncbi:MAG: sigma-54 dependent transcriptional regulator [Flavobacteriales bacterium]|nr:sigma-54 dependent transcriptional regulator [Flavobacteriales bacterium]MCX7650288.1 sigma-54 dependent transcriptional regulator [Flavobacteriales bacterium]MDW8431922.1 sigma-54 dependent transcriptional regulator [Flavobacteriales bacterium]
MSTVLIVDDEKSIRNILSEILKNEGLNVLEAENGPQALELFKKQGPDLVFCDIKMPGMDGVELLKAMMEHNPETPVVMLSGHGTIETAVECIKSGAYDFISKPVDLNRLLVTLRNALEKKSLVRETKSLKKSVTRSKYKEIIGQSESIQKIRELIARVAPTDARVLITGSNGTGKELVARAIHALSKRSEQPLIEVNCAAIPSELIESELFGHEKGSFTSALKTRKGKFELAHGGTLFLDEVGDMSLAAQAKVLRALQENKITRVGGDEEIKVDVRVIAATNKDLEAEIRKGNFREDLLHRLAVIPIHVPDLNDRPEDIPILAQHFLKEILQEQNMPPKKFTNEALEELTRIRWNGNVRELRNVVERLVILCDKVITGEDVRTFAKPAKSRAWE